MKEGKWSGRSLWDLLPPMKNEKYLNESKEEFWEGA